MVMNMTATRAVTVCLLMSVAAAGQAWKKTIVNDQLYRTSYLQFELDGEFLIAPQNAPSELRPAIIVRCAPASKPGHTLGNFLTGYLYVGAVLAASVEGRRTFVPVEISLDGRKVQYAPWSEGSASNSAFFSDTDFANILYGHILVHKEGTSAPVSAIIFGAPEFGASRIEMKFAMPDPTEVADACGEIWHKNKIAPLKVPPAPVASGPGGD